MKTTNKTSSYPITADVNVVITLSKTVSLSLTDYTIKKEKKQDYVTVTYHVSEEQLLTALKEQIIMPQDASLYIDIGSNPKAASDLSGWNVDKIECTKK